MGTIKMSDNTIISIDGAGNPVVSVVEDKPAATIDAFGEQALKSRKRAQEAPIEMLSKEQFEKDSKVHAKSKIVGPYILLVKSLTQSVTNLQTIAESQKGANATLRAENEELKASLARLTSPEYIQTLRDQIAEEQLRNDERA